MMNLIRMHKTYGKMAIDILEKDELTSEDERILDIDMNIRDALMYEDGMISEKAGLLESTFWSHSIKYQECIDNLKRLGAY